MRTMKPIIIAAAVLFAASPALAQNDTAATNADVNAAAPATTDLNAAAPAAPVDANVTTDVNTTTVDTTTTAPAEAPAPEKKHFPWGVIGLLGLIGLIPRTRSK